MEKKTFRINAVGGIELMEKIYVDHKFNQIEHKKTIPFGFNYSTMQEVKENDQMPDIIKELKELFKSGEWKIYRIEIEDDNVGKDREDREDSSSDS